MKQLTKLPSERKIWLKLIYEIVVAINVRLKKITKLRFFYVYASLSCVNTAVWRLCLSFLWDYLWLASGHGRRVMADAYQCNLVWLSCLFVRTIFLVVLIFFMSFRLFYMLFRTYLLLFWMYILIFDTNKLLY